MKEIQFHTHSVEMPNLGWQKPKIKRFYKPDWKSGHKKLGANVIMPDGQWIDAIDAIPLEVQNQYCETMHCWIWNSISIVVDMIFVQFGVIKNYSERFSGVMGGATPNGGSPQSGCETIRKDGLLPQEYLPWTPDLNTFWKFSSPRPMLSALIQKALNWKRQYEFKHAWVVYPSLFGRSKVAGGGNMQETMKQALTRSPLGVAVYAWLTDSNGLCYTSPGNFNHWTKIVGYVDGQYWIVKDSYTNCWRKLRWDYYFLYVKEYEINKSAIAQEDAEYIKLNFNAKIVKGDEQPAIYWIYGGQKRVFPSGEELANIANAYWNGDKSFITVSQDALDLIEDGEPMRLEKIKNIVPFNDMTIENNHS